MLQRNAIATKASMQGGVSRFLSLRSPSLSNPLHSPSLLPERSSSVPPLSAFLKRTDDIRKLLNLLDKKDHPATTSEDSKRAKEEEEEEKKNKKKPWQALDVNLTSFVVAEVVRICADLDSGLLLFSMWKEEFLEPGSRKSAPAPRSVSRAQESELELCLERESGPESGSESESDRIWVYASVMNRLGRARRIEEMEAVAVECESNGSASTDTFAAQLRAYRDMGMLEEATKTWKRMERFGAKPNLAAYTALLDAFAMARMYDTAADVYLLLLREGFFPNVRTLTALIHHMADGGRVEAAMEAFAGLAKVKVKPNEITYSALMRGYAKVGRMEEVLKLARRFKHSGNRPFAGVFPGLLRLLSRDGRAEDGDRVLAELWPESGAEDRKAMMAEYAGSFATGGSSSREGGYDYGGGPYEEGMDFRPSIEECSCDSVEGSYTDEEIEYAGRCMRPNHRAEVLNYVGLVRCLNPWTPATAAVLEHARVEWNAHLVFELMKRIRSPDVGWKFFVWVEGRDGFVHDKYTYARMIQLLLSGSDLTRAKQLLVEAESRRLGLSLHTYNCILKLCGERREAGIALDVFELARKAEGLKPDRESYVNLLSALDKCGRYWRVATVCSEMAKVGFGLDADIYSFLVCGFARAGRMKYAKAFYKRMRSRGLHPGQHFYEAFIAGFYRTRRLEKAEEMFELMKRDGLAPSSRVYNLMIRVLSEKRNRAALREIECERKSRRLMRTDDDRRSVLDPYLDFYRMFRRSFEEAGLDEIEETSAAEAMCVSG